MTRLDIDALIDVLDRFQHRLFRLEQLPAYAVADDGDDYHRWRNGSAEPTWSRKTPWLDVLRADRAAGKDRCRVRILTTDVTDYERYAIHWGYALNQPAGEDIRVLRHNEHAVPRGLPQVDFWVLDDDAAVTMTYAEGGDFVHATLVADPALYITVRDLAWAASEPFTTWWGRHPELHDPRTITA